MSEAGLGQIVPRAPGDAGGVGDFARQLATHLRDLHGVATTFLSAAPTESAHTTEGFAVLSPLRNVFYRIDPSLDLLLHYVNYGYDRRGIPFWLPALLAKRQKAGRSRLVTVFHELYAAGSWRQSAFWLRPLQKHLVRAIAKLSSRSIVTNETHRAQLQRLVPETEIIVQPVPSNFGEPNISENELAARDPHRWVICGGNELLKRSLTSLLQNVSLIPQACAPRELYVVGGVEQREIRALLARFPDRQTHYLPDVESAAAAEILSSCAFAWLDYFHDPSVPMATILKSTVFAAYCAHGVIPVFPHGGSPIHLGQESLSGPYFLNGGETNLPSESERAAVAYRLHSFYQQHASARKLALTVANALGRSN